MASRNEFDKTIAETESAYMKVYILILNVTEYLTDLGFPSLYACTVHCDRPYHSSWWFGYIFCSITYIFKMSFTFRVTYYYPKSISK